MMPIRDAYLAAADSAVSLINQAAVSRAWSDPSALAGFTVGGLAAHLAGQIFSARTALTQDPPDLETVPLLGHYERATWVNADLDAEINIVIRGKGEKVAEDGPAALRAEVKTLAFSLGMPTPDQPSYVLDPVLSLLTKLSVRQHGQAALIRALTRKERAPESVTAF